MSLSPDGKQHAQWRGNAGETLQPRIRPHGGRAVSTSSEGQRAGSRCGEELAREAAASSLPRLLSLQSNTGTRPPPALLVPKSALGGAKSPEGAMPDMFPPVITGIVIYSLYICQGFWKFKAMMFREGPLKRTWCYKVAKNCYQFSLGISVTRLPGWNWALRFRLHWPPGKSWPHGLFITESVFWPRGAQVGQGLAHLV